MKVSVSDSHAEFIIYAWFAEGDGLVEVEVADGVHASVDSADSITRLRPTEKGAELMRRVDMDPNDTSDMAVFVAMVGDVHVSREQADMDAELP